VRSAPGKGTTFDLYFPRVPTTPAGPAAETQKERPKGRETVLVVEDEDIVRRVTVKALRNAGYIVHEAPGGQEALAKLNDGLAVDLLLTDVVMPGMNGRTLAGKMREKFPDLPVLFMSGYGEDIIAHQGLIDPGVAFIEKSFTAQTLCRKVRDVLDGGAVPS
jgi:two-component system, cell cycle sensor histidine kinase and response regulator CckA